VKLPSIKFTENPFTSSEVVTTGQTYGNGKASRSIFAHFCLECTKNVVPTTQKEHCIIMTNTEWLYIIYIKSIN
jgi:hypothetical protein